LSKSLAKHVLDKALEHIVKIIMLHRVICWNMKRSHKALELFL
jgi:hypothetical protein